MKERWLTLILRITNSIYQIKQETLATQGGKVVVNVVILIILELYLACISFPLYLTTSAEKASAFFEKKGGYKKVAVDYHIRRVLTLTGVGVLFVISFIKIVIIFVTPAVYGPLDLYHVSELEPVAVSDTTRVAEDTGVQTAQVVEELGVPDMTAVEKKGSDTYVFQGKGVAGKEVVLFVVGAQDIMYTTNVDEKGSWRISHSQQDIALSPGIHSIFAFHYDAEEQVRGKAGGQQYFRVDTSFLDTVMERVDSTANISIIGVVILGILLTLLTL